MRKKDLDEVKLYVADFETVVEEDAENQTETEVWAASLCEVLRRPEPEDVEVFNNIVEFINALSLLEDESIVFFHNAKFDCSFLIDELESEGFIPAMSTKHDNKYAEDWEQNMSDCTYKASISAMGQWYGVRVRFDDRSINIRDSAKKLPMDLKSIGKNFHTKYQKLTMQYENDAEVKHRAFGDITPEEMAYIKNDVLVLSEAMYIIWYDYHLTGITLGSDCLTQFKGMLGPEFDLLFPSMTNNLLSEQGGPEITPYEYCIKAYSGGWCWKNPVSKNKVFKSDITYPENLEKKFKDLYSKNADIVDVKNIMVIDYNSLYPSSMHSMSGNKFPVGFPTWHKGEPKASEKRKYAIFRRFKCRFRLKKGYLPFIHIRGDIAYKPNECLTTSDIKGKRYYKSRDKVEHDTLREYTMTQVEFDLFKKHYEVLNYEPIDYLTFEQKSGIFDIYIDKYSKMKIEATKEGNKAKRTVSKMLLNNLYGKLGQSTTSSYKLINVQDGVMKFNTFTEYNKNPIYVPAAAYITSCARRATLTAGQANYYEGEYRGVMYSDTDSLHLVDYTVEDIKEVRLHATDFCAWDCEESSCVCASYAKQKTYLELSTESSFKTRVDNEGNPTYEVILKAAGLGEMGKQLFIDRLFLDKKDECKVYVDNFRPGLSLAKGNLKAKQIKGGIVLVPEEFKLS